MKGSPILIIDIEVKNILTMNNQLECLLFKYIFYVGTLGTFEPISVGVLGSCSVGSQSLDFFCFFPPHLFLPFW